MNNLTEIKNHRVLYDGKDGKLILPLNFGATKELVPWVKDVQPHTENRIKGSVGFPYILLINDKSSNELAVIGTGDVLAGIISSLVGDKKMNPIDAASAGVWIHSKIAINLKKGLIAEDLIKNLKKTINYIYGKYS